MNTTIKPETIEALERYLKQHVATGGFLRAVLENDLRMAVQRADHDNLKALKAIMLWLHENAPHRAWGSPEAVKAWLLEKPVED